MGFDMLKYDNWYGGRTFSTRMRALLPMLVAHCGACNQLQRGKIWHSQIVLRQVQGHARRLKEKRQADLVLHLQLGEGV